MAEGVRVVSTTLSAELPLFSASRQKRGVEEPLEGAGRGLEGADQGGRDPVAAFTAEAELAHRVRLEQALVGIPVIFELCFVSSNIFRFASLPHTTNQVFTHHTLRPCHFSF